MKDKMFERQVQEYCETAYSVRETKALGIKFIVAILYRILLELREK